MLNHLRSIQKPFVEKILRYLTLFFLDIDDFFRNGCRFRTALLHPSYPSKRSSIYKILRKNNISITNRPHPSNIITIQFSDATFSQKSNFVDFDVNANALDISKKNVDNIHQIIFGYSTILDPLRHAGRALIKSNFNAQHDGVEIELPVQQIEKDKIYQILIDNSEQGWYVDYRVCLINKEIPLIYKKFKTLENRYTNNVSFAQLSTLESIPEEIRKKIIQFCETIGCNFCELDVLKDNLTHLWYVIDINKTPYGPPAVLSKKETKKAVQILSESFYQQFIK
jgi:hypothetical protein